MAIEINCVMVHQDFPIRVCRKCRFSCDRECFAALTEKHSSFSEPMNAFLADGRRDLCDAHGSFAFHTVCTGKQQASGKPQSSHFTSFVCESHVHTIYGMTLLDTVF
jgi:hypothetical protein